MYEAMIDDLLEEAKRADAAGCAGEAAKWRAVAKVLKYASRELSLLQPFAEANRHIQRAEALMTGLFPWRVRYTAISLSGSVVPLADATAVAVFERANDLASWSVYRQVPLRSAEVSDVRAHLEDEEKLLEARRAELFEEQKSAILAKRSWVKSPEGEPVEKG